MDVIKSQDIPDILTHVTEDMKSYHSIQKSGIEIKPHQHYMLWKPESFWISMNYDWERWCYHEEFGNITNRTICDVKLKNELKLFKVTNLEEAEVLTKILMPDVKPHRFFGGECRIADMLTMSIYMTDKLKEGILIGPEFWDPIIKNYDGVYFLNSGTLHFDTFFNTWDAHSIALFDGKNATLSNPRSSKEIVDKIKEEE